MENIIDAKNRLSTRHIKKFKQTAQNEEIVTIYCDEFNDKLYEFKMTELRKFFELDTEIKSMITHESVISFVTSSTILQISGYDYIWWTSTRYKKPLGKLNRLFSEDIELSQTKSDVEVKAKNRINCAIARLEDDGVSKTFVSKFSGKINECIDHINKVYAYEQIRTFFNEKLVFAIDYADDIELSNHDIWKTRQQLIDEGVFTL